jgi:three-Cys-motif partner protein
MKKRRASAKGKEFFKERADQSEVKARIVTKYFLAWARIIVAAQARAGQREFKVAYIDLFAGPGRYEDGSASTPIMVLTEAHKIPELRNALVPSSTTTMKTTLTPWNAR